MAAWQVAHALLPTKSAPGATDMVSKTKDNLRSITHAMISSPLWSYWGAAITSKVTLATAPSSTLMLFSSNRNQAQRGKRRAASHQYD